MKKTNEIKNVALYIRVSTDRQAKEGDSLEAQENALKKYCKENNLIIVDTYIDGGESGQKLKRTNLQRMLNDVKDHKIDLILMTKLDRWFRNIADFYKVLEILKSNNVDWKTIWEDYDTTTASGEFWLNMSLSMGQMEAKRTSERINEVFNYKYNIQKTVCSGEVPYGYKISEDKKIIIDEEKSKNVIALFEHYAKTNNLKETTQWFNDNIEKRVGRTLRRYLTNPAYIGKYKKYRSEEYIDDFIPAIIDKELWDKVQRLLDINVKNYNSFCTSENKRNKEPYIFSCLVVCACCGHTMSGKTNTNLVHYYACKYHNKNRFSTYCGNKYAIREDCIEEYLRTNIKEILNKRKSELINLDYEKEKVIDNTKQLKLKLQKLADLYLNELIDLDYYKEQYNEINSKINTIKEKKEVIKNSISYDYIDKFIDNDFFQIYDKLDNLEKRRLWSTVIDRIEVNEKKEMEVFVY